MYYKTLESNSLPNELRSKLRDEKMDVLLDYPTVYVHAWKENGKWHIYIGETYDIVRRTKEHYSRIIKDYEQENDPWQSILYDRLSRVNEEDGPFLYVFGNEKFNRSMTLDLEDMLIDTFAPLNDRERIVLHNGRGNKQERYSNCDLRNGFYEDIMQVLRNSFEDLRQELISPEFKHKTPIDISDEGDKVIFATHVWNLKKRERSDDAVKELSDELESSVKELFSDERKRDLLLDHPMIYIHVFADKGVTTPTIYVGEAKKLCERLGEHLFSTEADWHADWQAIMFGEKEGFAESIAIGHPSFNKSMTLDLENKLINYMIMLGYSCNGRTNEQNKYDNKDQMLDLFNAIINKLGSIFKGFVPVEELQAASVFWRSPFMKMTEGQEEAKSIVLNEIRNRLYGDVPSNHQLILVEGGAGTGKTVLLAGLFFTLFQERIDCRFIVNNDELFEMYSKKADAWQLTSDENKKLVMKAEQYININQDNSVDVAIIDEGHLLYTQGHQGSIPSEQLSRIIKCAKITVMVFDPYQFYETGSYWSPELIDKMRQAANVRIELKEQLRMNCAEGTENWIRAICNDRRIPTLEGKIDQGSLIDSKGYIIRIYDSLPEMIDEINRLHKAGNMTALMATYEREWPYYEDSVVNMFQIDKYPNLKLFWSKTGSGEFRKADKCSESVASTHDVQGSDLDYAGVIIGKSVSYTNGLIKFQREIKNRTVNGESIDVSAELISHELYILLTRAVKGMFIYACDDELNNALLYDIVQKKETSTQTSFLREK